MQSYPNLKYQNRNSKPIKFESILAEAYRLRHKHPISISFLQRKFMIDYALARKIKHKIDAYDARNPIWYPDKPDEERKETLDDFVKRITPKR